MHIWSHIYCTGSVMCLYIEQDVMFSTSKLPVKTHDQATDHMVNLPIKTGKRKGECSQANLLVGSCVAYLAPVNV